LPQSDGVTYLPTPGYFESVVSNASGQFTLTTKDKTVYTFANIPGKSFAIGSAVYRLVSMVDRNQNTTALSYVGGQLSTVTDPYGRLLTFSYNVSGHLASVTDPLGRTTTLGYDASGAQLAAITDSEGNAVTYTYNPAHQLSQRTDRDGRVMTFSYQDGKPAAISDGNAQSFLTLSNSSDWATEPAAITNSELRLYVPSTTTRFDGRGNSWTYSYDTNASVTSAVAPDGSTRTYTYNPAVVMPATATDANGNTTTYEYDSQGNRTNVTDALGEVNSYTYDPVFNEVTSMTDPDGRVTTYQYDAHGNRTNEIDPLLQTRSWP
jgi:YD repeat-containing protein